MRTPETLHETFEAAVRAVMLEMAALIVADQGVEIHQWLRDEKARRRGQA